MASQAVDCKTRINVFWHAARLAAQVPPSAFEWEWKIPRGRAAHLPEPDTPYAVVRAASCPVLTVR
jgi:hypothetical protein